MKKSVLFFFLLIGIAQAHPMPNTLVQLRIHPHDVVMEVKIPVSDVEIALKQSLAAQSSSSIQRLLAAYFRAHIQVKDFAGNAFTYVFEQADLHQTTDANVGKYDELVAKLRFLPPVKNHTTTNTRTFALYYDAILHEIRNHKALVSVTQDWATGLHENAEQQLGVIEYDTQTNTLYPLHISLEKGSDWRGFKRMVELGLQHIADGTDHLLFLLVLLLPAPLIAAQRRWKQPQKPLQSVFALAKISLAFTLGHSLTLLIGSLQWVTIPAQPVEIAIAISILVGAIHALRPVFAGREAYVAAFLGLIHGLAFATVLSQLDLDMGRMLLGILGFNLGIELMQLWVMILTVPWLLLLSATSWYTWIRISGAIFALEASAAWAVERYTGESNIVVRITEQLTNRAGWLLLLLALIAICRYGYERWRRKTKPSIG